MVIRNEERRKFAENLRYIAQHPPEWATSACAIAEVFDANYPLWKDSGELFDILADLIDRPTYRPVILNEMDGGVFCPQCGTKIGEYGVPNYCYNCGVAIRNAGCGGALG